MGLRMSRYQAITPGIPQKSPSDAKQLKGKKKLGKRLPKAAKPSTKLTVETAPNLDENQLPVTASVRSQSATLVHQQQYQTASSGGSVVITIRMLKMEPNDLQKFVQHHHMQQQQQEQQRLNPILKYEQHSLTHQRQHATDSSNNNGSTGSNIVSNTGNQFDNRFSFTRKQFNCDKSNTISTNNEQNGNLSITNSYDPFDIEEKINQIRLTETWDHNQRAINDDGTDSDARNDNAICAATTRFPFEYLRSDSIIPTALSTINDIHQNTGNRKPEVIHDCDNNDSYDVHCVHCQKRKKSHQRSDKSINKGSKIKKSNWGLRFNCAKLKRTTSSSAPSSSTSNMSASAVSNESQQLPKTVATPTVLQPNMMEIDIMPEINSLITNAAAQLFASNEANAIPETTLMLDNSPLCKGSNVILVSMNEQSQPLLDFSRYNADDCDKKARLQRAIEIEEGVEPPPGFMPSSIPDLILPVSSVVNGAIPSSAVSTHWQMLCPSDAALRLMIPNLMQRCDEIPRIHSQVDYIHCLVPDLKKITSCSFYWGKMDRYEAERLLESKPEGTFLLRDSAQEEFLFSVSFRKYGRSLHARIEQFNHKFSFDCHDPGVYTSSTVTGLLEHYKDPACVMFFEPALTLPLNRNNVFSLQQLSRATIVSHTTYDGIDSICLPKQLKSYLKEYHYKQRVRVKRFDEPCYNTS